MLRNKPKHLSNKKSGVTHLFKKKSLLSIHHLFQSLITWNIFKTVISIFVWRAGKITKDYEEHRKLFSHDLLKLLHCILDRKKYSLIYQFWDENLSLALLKRLLLRRLKSGHLWTSIFLCLKMEKVADDIAEVFERLMKSEELF